MLCVSGPTFGSGLYVSILHKRATIFNLRHQNLESHQRFSCFLSFQVAFSLTAVVGLF